MRRALLLLTSLLGACGPHGHSSSGPRPAKLVVLLVIDQLPTWAFERDRALFTGGFARLLREGAYVRAGELPYGNPFTAVGHASIATGASPNVHGIVGNTWYHRDVAKDVAAETDPAAPVFAVTGAAPLVDTTASGAALRVDGVADALRAAHPEAHAIAIALKARGAVFVAGRQPELAIWYEPRAGGMTTSRAYAAEVPAWLRTLAQTSPPRRFVGQTWTALDPALLARATQIPDDGAGETDLAGLGTTFPHPVADEDAMLHTPFGDRIVLETVEAALAALPLGEDDTPDLLAISLNAHDYVGHIFGPDSWEVLDLTLRLDRALDALFTSLDRKVGADGWALVMTSDHGGTPIVERSPYPDARRITTASVVLAVNAALTPLLGEGAWVAKISSNQLYLASTVSEAQRDRALAIATTAILAMPGIERVFPIRGTTGHCETRPALAQAICLGLAPDNAGDLYIVAKRGSQVTDYAAGTHHDAPTSDNREVPILVRAPGLAPRTIARASFLQVAPTVAALLGVPPPSAATSPPLFGLRR